MKVTQFSILSALALAATSVYAADSYIVSSSGDDENPFAASNPSGGVSSVVTSPSAFPPAGTSVSNPDGSNGSNANGGQVSNNPLQSGTGAASATTSPVGFTGNDGQQGIPFGSGSESSQGIPFGGSSGQNIPTGTQNGENGFPTSSGVANSGGFGTQNGSPSVFPLPGASGSSFGGSNSFPSSGGSEGGYITTTLTIAIPIPTGGAHNASETARITHQNGGALGNAHIHGFTVAAAVLGAVIGAILM